MKKFLTTIALVVAAILSPMVSYAQFSRILQMAQAQQAISNNSFTYKGFADAGYQAGVGKYKANRFEVTTSHGITTGNLFMGIGVGLDVLKTDTSDEPLKWNDMDLSDNAYMVPLFLDFRYFGTGQIAAFFDIKTGISILAGDSYITIDDGVFDNDVSFYLNCSIGARFAMSGKTALNVGVNYGLISQKYYSYNNFYHNNRYDGISLHAIGISVGFEW